MCPCHVFFFFLLLLFSEFFHIAIWCIYKRLCHNVGSVDIWSWFLFIYFRFPKCQSPRFSKVLRLVAFAYPYLFDHIPLFYRVGPHLYYTCPKWRKTTRTKNNWSPCRRNSSIVTQCPIHSHSVFDWRSMLSVSRLLDRCHMWQWAWSEA